MFTHHRFSIIAVIFSTCILVSGCHLTEQPQVGSFSYGEYYLALQQYSELELANEVENLQKQIAKIPSSSEVNDYDNQIKLLLLYSLPQSPIYNSFNAKALLNQMKKEGNNVAFATIKPHEQAFITLLRDQLNQRLLMHNRLQLQQQNQQKLALAQQQKLLAKIALLEQTIAQLKKIDQAIDKREQ